MSNLRNNLRVKFSNFILICSTVISDDEDDHFSDDNDDDDGTDDRSCASDSDLDSMYGNFEKRIQQTPLSLGMYGRKPSSIANGKMPVAQPKVQK